MAVYLPKFLARPHGGQPRSRTVARARRPCQKVTFGETALARHCLTQVRCLQQLPDGLQLKKLSDAFRISGWTALETKETEKQAVLVN